MAFRRGAGNVDVEGYEHAGRLWTLTLEIAVLMAQFPSAEIAQRSYDFRTLGPGYANLGGLLMAAGVPYDSDKGRAVAAAVPARLTGIAYAPSAEMADALWSFPRSAQHSHHTHAVRRARKAD